MDLSAEYARCQSMVEEALKGCFQGPAPWSGLLEAMRYSLLAGGKRVRPILTMKCCEAAGGGLEQALPYACAVEMLHTYSLIHDDLPCMDDDDLRRGKPTNHKVFGECTAVLAGDALQAAAFQTILSAQNALSLSTRALIGASLAEAAGPDGICGGQYLDMDGEGKALTEKELHEIHDHKTAALLRAACGMGVLASGTVTGMEDPRMGAVREYATQLGLAFQIRDDILDATSTTQVLGKPVGSDAASEKHTFMTLYGAEECERLVRRHTEQAKAALRGAFSDTAFLEWLADSLAGRTC